MLTIGAGVTVSGYAASVTTTGGSVVNNGTVLAVGAGQTLTVNPALFTNNGTLGATTGTLNAEQRVVEQRRDVEPDGGTINLGGVSPARA